MVIVVVMEMDRRVFWYLKFFKVVVWVLWFMGDVVFIEIVSDVGKWEGVWEGGGLGKNSLKGKWFVSELMKF